MNNAERNEFMRMLADAVIAKVTTDVIRDMIKNYEISYNDLDNDEKLLVDYFDYYDEREKRDRDISK